MCRRLKAEDILIIVFIVTMGAVCIFSDGCASVEAYSRAHPEVLNAADDLCKVVHAAHEAEAIDAGTAPAHDAAKLETNPYMTWEQVTDGGAPPAPEGTP